jgi:hypothetical protein
VSDQDKAWIRIDNSGRPIGTYVFYSGNWRKQPSGLKTEVRVFTGDPAIYFDTSGLGKQNPDDWDGWAICNGNNGTPDLSNQFVVGGAMNNGDTPPLVGGYSAGWTTKVTGDTLKTGGSNEFLLVNTNLPFQQFFVSGRNYDASGSHGATNARAIVTGDWGGSQDNIDKNAIGSIGVDPAGTPPGVQASVPTVPPFYAVAFAMWVGYA